MPRSLADTATYDTFVWPASYSRMPQDCVWVKLSGPQTLVRLHSFPETCPPEIVAVAASLIWIPFCAMAGDGPAPMVVTPVIVAELPVPSTVIPFFW